MRAIAAFTPTARCLAGTRAPSPPIASTRGTERLSYINKQPSLGSILAHNSLDRTGRFLFVANYSLYPEPDDSLPDQSVVVFPDPRGRRTCGPPSAAVPTRAAAPMPPARRGRTPIASSPVPTTAHVLVADLGIDQLVVYRFDAASGVLSATTASFSDEGGSGTQALRLPPFRPLCLRDQRARFDDRGSRVRRAVRRTRAPADGVRAPVRICRARAIARALQLTPDGRYLYGSNRGHDSLVVYAIDKATGRLSFVEHQPCLGRTPRDFDHRSVGTLPSRRQPGQRRGRRFPHRPRKRPPCRLWPACGDRHADVRQVRSLPMSGAGVTFPSLQFKFKISRFGRLNSGRNKEMSNRVTRVQTARAAAAVSIACIVGWSAGAKAANENLLEGLPDSLKSLYEGQTDTLQPSAYDNFKMPPPPWKWCHSEVLSRQSVARRADQRTQASGRRLQSGGQGQQISSFPTRTATPAGRSRRSAPSSTRNARSSPPSPARRPVSMTRSRPPTRREFRLSRFRVRSPVPTPSMSTPTMHGGATTWRPPSKRP